MNSDHLAGKLTREASSAYKQGDYEDAAHQFTAAAQAFTASGDQLMAAEMANNACVAFVQAKQYQAALSAVEGTPATFTAAGDVRRQGMALGNYASALEGLNRVDEALDAYQQAADVLQQAGEDHLRVNVMQSMSSLQMRRGRHLEALASMQSGLEGVHKPSPKQRFLKRLLSLPFRMMNR